MRKLLLISSFCMVFGSVSAQVKREYTFDSFMDGISLLHTGDSMNIWGFQRLYPDTSRKLLPSPTIYCELGDTVEITVINTSFEGHTIHLHGLDVDQANDGVPSTSFFIQPGQTGKYSFVATHTGNYLYHCHVTSVMHVQLGMYGMLVVAGPGGEKEMYPGGPKYVKEYAWLGAEIDKSWHDDYTSIGSFTNFFPDFFHVSGKSRQQIWEDSAISIYDARINEPILIRAFNIGFGIQEHIFPSSLTVKAIMSDGRVLPSQVELDTLRLYPGERYGLMMWPGSFTQDSITVNFRNMLRDQLWATDKIPIEVNGVYGVEKAARGQIVSIFPNPSSGELNIRAQMEIKNIELYDVHGQRVWSDLSLDSRDRRIELRVSEGVYILKLNTEEKAISKRIIVVSQ